MLRETRPLRRYGVAAAAVLLALLLTPLARPFLEPTPFFLFLVATLTAAWFGGMGPGLLAALLSGLSVGFCFLGAPGAPVMDLAAPRRLGVFVVATALIGALSSSRRRALAAARFLDATSHALAGSLDYQSTLDCITRLAVPRLADGCVLDLVADDGSVHPAPTDPARAEGWSRAVLRVVQRGEAEVYTRVPAAWRSGPAGVSPDMRSVLIVPLQARGHTLGALSLLRTGRGRPYRRYDLALAREFARRTALALDSARLYRKAQEAAQELRQQARQLADADRQKDEFLAVLGHELRNPLAPIRNALQVMRLRGQDRRATTGWALDMIERQVEHLVRLVEDLLDVSRVARGKIQFRKELVDVARVVGHAVQTVRPLLDARAHKLTVRLPPGPLRVEADPMRLQQVLANLLTNAAKYTDPGGQIGLTAERTIAPAPGTTEGEGPGRDWVVLRVRDNGVGIPPEMLGRVFDLFAQAERSLGQAQGGLGIGLTLVRRLVELHGGTVEAHSEGPGRGSEFVVRLPALPDTPVPATGPAPALAPVPQGAPRRVLIVDDNTDAAESLAMLLRVQSHEVWTAADGRQALEAAREHRPDVVILDIGLPDRDGYEVARELRREEGTIPYLLIALTGFGQEEDRLRAREAGFDHYLVKPVDPAVLQGLLGAAGG